MHQVKLLEPIRSSSALFQRGRRTHRGRIISVRSVQQTSKGVAGAMMHQEPEAMTGLMGNPRTSALDIFHDSYFACGGAGGEALFDRGPMSMGSVPSLPSGTRHRAHMEASTYDQRDSLDLLATTFSSTTSDRGHPNHPNHQEPTNNHANHHHQYGTLALQTQTPFAMSQLPHVPHVGVGHSLAANDLLLDNGGLFAPWTRPAVSPLAQLLGSPSHGALALAMQASQGRSVAEHAAPSPDPFRLPRVSQDPLSPSQAAVQQQLWNMCSNNNLNNINNSGHNVNSGGNNVITAHAQRPPLPPRQPSISPHPPAGGSSSTAEAGARLLGLDLWPSSDLLAMPSHGQDVTARQAWLDWQGAGPDRHSGRNSSTGQSLGLSDLVGLLSGQNIPGAAEQPGGLGVSGVGAGGGLMAGSVSTGGPGVPLPAPLVTAPSSPTIYCANCTMPVEEYPSFMQDHHTPLTCAHCNQPVAGLLRAAPALPPAPCLSPRQRSPAASAAAGQDQPPAAPATPAAPAAPAGPATSPTGSQAASPGSQPPGPTTHSMMSSPQHPGGWGGSGTVLGYDERMLAHSEPPTRYGGREHPERPSRLVAIMHQLNSTGLLARCQQVSGRPATDAELETVHEAELVRQVGIASRAAAGISEPNPDPNANTMTGANSTELPSSPFAENARWVVDCPMNAHTNDCARIAAGTAIDVAVAAYTRRARNGAAIIRPPGHHAESALSMGFCIFNNAAVAARAAQKAGARRVLIVDWDVHHGNGTAHAFHDDPSVLFISTHRWDRGYFFPGTGGPREAGGGAGVGHTVNVAWNGPGVTDQDCLLAFRHVVMPIATAYAPDLVIVSAGFDAARGDPLGECLLSPELYGHLTHVLSSLGPVVLLLEGGYNLAVTAECTAECVRVLLGGRPTDLPGATLAPSPAGMDAVIQTLQVHAPYWPAAREQLEALQEQQELMREQQELLRDQQGASSPPDTDLFSGLSGLDERLLSINQLDLEGESDHMVDCRRE